MANDSFDVVVIGAGPGGYVAAIRCGQLGLKTAVVEKPKTLGGTCLNWGCIPSKYLLNTSEIYHAVTHHQDWLGIDHKGIHPVLKQMMENKGKLIGGFQGGIAGLLKKNKVEHIEGVAQVKGAGKVQIGDRNLEAKNIILATGSEPIPLPFLPFDEERIVSSTGALALKEVPKKMIVVGAGVIGLELGSVYSRMGTEVTVVEFLDRICPSMDGAVAKAFQKTLEQQGMTFHLSSKVKGGERKGDVVKLSVEGPKGDLDMEADVVMVSIGRRPYSEGLGLEEAGVKKDDKGFAQVDQSLQTSLPNVYAIGDLVDGPMLAHKASEEGIAVAELIAGQHPHINYLAIPSVVYTWPEVASVGLTEEEAKSMDIKVKKGQFPFKANSRARCVGDEEGFVKILADKTTDKVLGMHILGPGASEMIALGVLAIEAGLTNELLARSCMAHPTLSEAVKEAALAVEGRPIHM